MTLVITFAVGALVGIGICYLRFNRQVAELKAHSDSSAQASQAVVENLDTRVRVAEDSLKKLATKKRVVNVRTKEADAAVAVLSHELAVVKKASDSVFILVKQVGRLTLEVADFKSLIALDSADIRLWRWRALSAEDDVHNLNGEVQDLNKRIMQLHPPPTLVGKVLKGASYVVTAVVAYKVGKKKG